MFRDSAEFPREGTIDIPKGLVPPEYIVRQRLRNLLDGPVMSRKAAMRVNMARIDAALLRGDRAQFERLAGERRYIRMEWPD